VLELETQNTNPDTQTSQPVESVEVDGLWVDQATGVVIGEVEPVADEGAKLSEDEAERVLSRMLFHASRKASAERALRKASAAFCTRHTAALEAFEDEPETIALRAQIANADRVGAQADRSLEFYEATYKPSLGELALRKLANAKARTLSLLNGQVSLRKVPARLTVADEAQAVAHCEAQGWLDALKKSVLVSKVPKEALDDIAFAEGTGFDLTAERDEVTIKLGIAA